MPEKIHLEQNPCVNLSISLPYHIQGHTKPQEIGLCDPMSEIRLPFFSFCCIYLWEKRSAQLSWHWWGSYEDLVKIGECCLAVVISLGLTIY